MRWGETRTLQVTRREFVVGGILTAGAAYRWRHLKLLHGRRPGPTPSPTPGPSPSPSPTAGSGTTYWVSLLGSDSGDGSLATPFRSIGHAASLVQPGDTVRVLPGAYGERVTVTRGGSPSARVRFISDTRWAASLYWFLPRRTVDSNPASGAAYTDFIGFELAGDPSYSAFETDASYTSLIGCKVHDCGGVHSYDAPWPTAGTSAYYPTVGTLIEGNFIYNIPNPTAYLQGDPGHSHGIYFEGQQEVARNNMCFRCQGWGIQMWHTATRETVVNNLCVDNGAGGIIVGAVGSDFPSQAPLKLNDYTLVNNNICVHNGYGSGAGDPYGEGAGRYGIDEEGSVGSHNSYAHNLLWQNSPNDKIYVIGGGSVAATVVADPRFVNYQPDGSGDYHSQVESPAIDAGTSQSAPPSDYDGVPRPQGAGYDVGPYER